MLMSQNAISPLSSEGSNKDVEVHLTAEEQNQAEARTYNTIGSVPLENRDVEVHLTAEEQNQAEARTYNTIGSVPLENRDVEVHLTAEEQNQVEQDKTLNAGNF
ncbi:hypothetical protein KXS12_26455 [Priestia filamentosa]|uniref:hypothetical protein n=1 Tax=Priestia filamentosa TaxID=1402861 RepID=UPI003F1400FF